MTSSLVGSEMCIRDSHYISSNGKLVGRGYGDRKGQRILGHGRNFGDPVSYTHLTLPTICSV
eukprot:8322007-Prorocentrum_lima.AAC.1